MGLQGMINDLVLKSDYSLGDKLIVKLKILKTKKLKVFLEQYQQLKIFQTITKNL